MEILKKRVLICEDNEDHIKELIDSFDLYNKNPQRDFNFDVTPAATIDEISDNLKGYSDWDVVIIDRKFSERDPSGSQFWEKHILTALNDLKSNTVRIIFTAHPVETEQYQNQDLIESMQLGAWDYINKNYDRTKEGDSYNDVVDSSINGLNVKRENARREILSIEACLWIREHSQNLMDKYSGQFVPILKKGEGVWEIIEKAADPSLFQVYKKLKDIYMEKEPIHIHWMAERR